MYTVYNKFFWYADCWDHGHVSDSNDEFNINAICISNNFATTGSNIIPLSLGGFSLGLLLPLYNVTWHTFHSGIIYSVSTNSLNVYTMYQYHISNVRILSHQVLLIYSTLAVYIALKLCLLQYINLLSFNSKRWQRWLASTFQELLIL